MKQPNLTGRELIAWLVANKSELIEAKKATVKTADACQIAPTWFREDTEATKGKYLYEDDEQKGVLKRTIVANTYLWLDSHMDVHLENIFASSIAQRSARPAPHLFDHQFSMLAKVGRPIKYEEREISWRELGAGKTGKTQALFLESEIRRDYNEKIYNEYKEGQVDQHSVAMRYIKILLAVNDEKEYPNEYKVWKEVIGKIGNRPAAEKAGYFWAVYEAALLETSAVLAGSNELTPTLGKAQPASAIENTDPQPPALVLDRKSLLDLYLNN